VAEACHALLVVISIALGWFWARVEWAACWDIPRDLCTDKDFWWNWLTGAVVVLAGVYGLYAIRRLGKGLVKRMRA
jgi:hypothetical protein